MTNEEAIKELKDASDSEVRYGDIDHHYDEVMKRVEAFDLAIKALEQQPCEECISREAVMKCFKKWQPYMATRLLDYEQELKELPSVTPTSDAEDKYDIGYNCGYADAMSDIAEGE